MHSILEMDATGISAYWRNRYYEEPKECNNPSKVVSLRGLYLTELQTTFKLLGFGYAIALLAFITELLLSKAMK